MFTSIQARSAVVAIVLTLSLAFTAQAANTTTTTFTNSDIQGWTGTGGFGGATFVDLADGNPAPSFRTSFPDFAIFGITFANDTNPAFLGDYTHTPFTFSVDAKTRIVGSFTPTVRDLILELRDYNNPPPGFQYVSVFYDLGDLRDPAAGGSGLWENNSVLVSDPTQAALPAGWGGTGAEDPVTFEPILPPDRTFASVLAGVDEVVLTTFRPGFFYIDLFFDVSVDNISLTFIPEPGALSVVASIGLLAVRCRR